jgi:WD40 repeat protein
MKDLQLYLVEKVTAKAAIDNPLLFVCHVPDRIVTLGLDRMLAVHKWKNSTPEFIPPFALELEKKRSKPRRLGVHFAVGLNILPFFFVVSRCGKFILSCGHWDNSFRCTHIETGQALQTICHHKDIVTCLAISQVGDVVVTGSKDTTVMVWAVQQYANAALTAANPATNPDNYLLEKPKHILYGHDDEVTVVAVNSNLDVVVSGSRDGTCIIHTLRAGRYVRTIIPPDRAPVRWIGISCTGVIVTYSLLDFMLHSFSINGTHLSSVDAGERLYALLFSEDGQFLLSGGDRKQVVVRSMVDLSTYHKLPPCDSTVRSMCLTPEQQHLLVGKWNADHCITCVLS